MSAWIRDPDPAAHTRILCLPSAGGGTVEYRQWRAPVGIEVCPVALPGREARLAERPIREMGALIAELTPAIEPLLDRPYVVFGHSMGSWVGFELIRELRRRKWPLPLRLFASGRRAPDLPDRLEPLHALPDGELVAALQARFNAIPAQLLAQPEVLALFLPALRADFALLETYRCAPEPPIPVPIAAWAGARDAAVDHPELQGWRGHTAARFDHRLFPGGHFYLRDAKEEVVASILDTLGTVPPGG
jgi:surfactin synthase thioesterase subunit